MADTQFDDVVAKELVGDSWPVNHPGADPVLYGHVSLEPKGAFEARSLQTFKLVYTVGRYGIDDTGSIRVVFRFMGDWGALQSENPTDYNFVSAKTNTGARLSLTYANTGHQRPWFKSLTVKLHGGYLSEGDTITIIFGDRSGGSPGMKLQTFCEPGFEFKVLADVCAVGHYFPLPETPHISIVPGEVHEWKAVLPSLRRIGEPFRLGLKAEDLWGNPTDRACETLFLESSHPVQGLPETVSYPLGKKSLVLEGLVVEKPGVVRILVKSEEEKIHAEAGPLLIEEEGVSGYWGDLHGQSGETIGLTTSRQYFDFARNKSFLDVTSHQANDFQVNNAFWKYLNQLTEEYHEDGRFVVFPGYEWSGNTAVGGDRNVFFREEGRQIRRSSHALLSDRSDLETDAPTASKLFEALQEEDCVVYAHVGGRYADISQAHDPRLETAMEIHSAWGTFEWLLTDGFPLGHRSGVVCNSDGHKGRPGASYPGAATFGAYGGLTCFLTHDLTRDGIFECLRSRHHYGTTGCRMHLEVKAHFKEQAIFYHQDPKAYRDPRTSKVREVMMGDIVETRENEVMLSLKILAHAPLERVEIRNGSEVCSIHRPFDASDLGSRIRVIWSGAEYRGRGRQTSWKGRADFRHCRILKMKKINAWNHEKRLQTCGTKSVEWDAVTTGNFGGFDVWLEEGDDAELDLASNHGSLRIPLNQIDLEDHVLDAGGLERQIRVFRLPEINPHREIEHHLQIPLKPNQDNPLWVCVTTEDGFQAWSSPIFVIPS